ncbi:hypothetical protein ME763_35410 [Streptomyces murinus]|uniref:hypothetical protein n=1 Tax=Streptomyces murinus TaxID=33900 RepID=UPI00117E29E1|nr:hypothetical protein [Streptomyces murinus]WDO10516.1 hypothetical protein ME763_35410 [Streptomyces murinus]
MALEAEGDLEERFGDAMGTDTPARVETAVQLTVRHGADQRQSLTDLSRLPDRDIVTDQVLGAVMP